MKKSVGVVTLGCDKNRVDTERMLYRLRMGGFDITNDYESAQVLIVNTCAFIEAARKEAIDVILAAAQYKTRGCEKLIVTGCLPAKHADELREALPEVDSLLGTEDYDRICDVIASLYGENDQLPCQAQALERIVTTPPHYAYLKIADGCDNCCTFCTIPSIRGAYRSYAIEKLTAEAQALAENGAKELILVAQDVTKYGVDLYGSPRLVELLRRLSETDIHTLRLLYCYPEQVTDELIEEIARNEKIADYIDVPIQHVADGVLKRMNRRSTGAQIRTLFAKLRAHNIAVRTTVMVGFPQETEEDYNELYRFIEQYAPEHVGVFAYSKEDGTPSARLKGHLPKKIKKARADGIGLLHYKNREAYNKAMVGKTLRVIYEDIDYDKNMFAGRSDFDAPDIDTKVYFTADFVEAGEYYTVKITGYNGYDLIGEKVS
ncbi:MAG: 30S ribosomal protein S12 methylthiotransferase RimO [Clostridia bacterium]|jgi:ribosomal protein S12 methylthiotransferase|nr:30S ribosomal protein S12 methylthiotransferase RimO [Clostridia bacterium]